ncbi:TetR/AcrR family transcriptional regulator [Kribbella italica]|uniref:AcrR family transcriptional regulator n=1 Tax=Kribbella italica TaxID=1540520 RepID=A0A7W9J851_9ACTN|nr:TetR/AcrR family transcriptional regulator [Kribbella italica]MBB5837084.1 AcrR family transcriptional regulator [Kribbella italica]
MSSLRERRKAETRQLLQRQAIRLFQRDGYDATTMNTVAEAAGVSAMTVYRHFPTKEDLVIWDEYTPVSLDVLVNSPTDDPLVRRIGHALIETATAGTTPDHRDLLLARLQLMVDVPALRARHLDNQYATQNAIVTALCGDDPDPDQEFQTRAISGACLGATHIALVHWARTDGKQHLPTLIREALTATFPADFS